MAMSMAKAEIMSFSEFCSSLGIPTDGLVAHRLYLSGGMQEPQLTVFREKFMVHNLIHVAMVQMQLEQLLERTEQIEAKLDRLLNDSQSH